MRRSSIASAALLLGLTIAGHAQAQQPSYSQFGSGCAGNGGPPLLTADAQSLPELGSTFRAQLSQVADGPAIGILGLSTSSWAGFSLPLELDLVGMPGCLLYTDLRRTTPLTVIGGQATWDTILPSGPEWLGRSFFQQVLILDSGLPGPGAVISNAAEGVIGVLSPAPRAAIVFPPPNSQTDADTILVRGSAFDPDGVAEVSVNGIPATSSDAFENWQVRVPLAPMVNVLTVETLDSLGNFDPQATEARIDHQARLQDAEGMVIDRLRNRALVTDPDVDAVVAVNLTTGKRRVLSSASRGLGPMWLDPAGIALNGVSALVVDRNTNAPAIFEVDLVTGDRRVLSDDLIGEGPGFFGPVGIAIDLPRNRALVADKYKGAVFAVAIDGPRVLVANEGLDALLSVDLTTGELGSLDKGIGAGPKFETPVGITLDRTRALITDPNLGSIFAVELATGDRAVVTSELGSPSGIAFDGIRALVIDQDIREVVSVDLVTGGIRTFTRGSLAAPSAIVVAGNRALLADTQTVYSVLLVTGTRVGLSHGSARPTGLALDGDRVLMTEPFGTPAGPRILAIRLADGSRTTLSDSSIGEGPDFAQLQGIAVDRARALITETSYSSSWGRMLAVDLVTGDRSLLSDGSDAAGPPMLAPGGIVVDRDLALVADRKQRAIHAVDVQTGERVILSK